MRTAPKVLLAGIAAVALTGFVGLAVAKGPAFHTMTVELPDGGNAQIQYSGNIPPKVTFDSSPMAAGFYPAVWPFVTFDRISNAMDQEMTAVMHQADLFAMPLWNPSQVFHADLHNAPAGTTQYSFVSTMSGNNACVRTMQITSTGNGAQPKVVSRASGNCGPSGNASFGIEHSIQPDHASQNTLRVNYTQNAPQTAAHMQSADYR